MKKSGLLLVLSLWAMVGLGQVAPRPADWQTVFFEAPAVALPLLVTAAVAHSAELAAIKTDQAMTHEDIQLARKAILSSVLLTNNYGYGNISSITLADQSLPGSLAASSSTHYSTAINLNLPLDRLLSRRNQISRQRLQYQKFDDLRKAQENAVGQHVIDLYQGVLLTHRVLPLRQQAYLTAQLNFQLAEKEFRGGEITLAEFSQLNDRYLNAAIEQENATNAYATAFLSLEHVVGGRISEIMDSK